MKKYFITSVNAIEAFIYACYKLQQLYHERNTNRNEWDNINSILSSSYSRFISFLPAPTVFLVQQISHQQSIRNISRSTKSKHCHKQDDCTSQSLYKVVYSKIWMIYPKQHRWLRRPLKKIEIWKSDDTDIRMVIIWYHVKSLRRRLWASSEIEEKK